MTKMRILLPVISLIFILLTYILGLTEQILLFCVFFCATFWLICISGMVQILKLFPFIRKKTYKQIILLVLISLPSLLLINKYLLPNRTHPISWIGNIGFCIFTLSLFWNVVREKINKKWLLISSTMFIVFISTLRIVSVFTSTKIELSSSEALKSLPYLAYSIEDDDLKKNGVTTYIRELADDGINIYCSRGGAHAYIVDKQGNIVHSWIQEESKDEWQYVKLYDENDLLVIVKDSKVLRLDWDSNLKWENNIRAHHEITNDENGNIYILARKDEIVVYRGLPVPILNDYIVVLSPDGKINEEISLYEVLKNEIPKKKIFEIYKKIIIPHKLIEMCIRKIRKGFYFGNDAPMDVFHTNTLELVDREIDGVMGKGNVLFCAKLLDKIGVIDVINKKLLWIWGEDVLQNPHYPTITENDTILIFDNGRKERSYTRILEINPQKEQIIWEFKANPAKSFYSSWGGASQYLSNGNILITNSTKGEVFEITKDGQIVWEFYNPYRAKNGKRATIYRMIRINDSTLRETVNKSKHNPSSSLKSNS